MLCIDVRASLSAPLDGEKPTLPPPRARPPDRMWPAAGVVRGSVDLHRSLRVQPAPRPDRTEAISPRSPGTDSGPHENGRSLRIVTLVIALVQLVAAVPLLFGISDDARPLSRHVGVFSAALAVGLLAVAWRPNGPGACSRSSGCWWPVWSGAAWAISWRVARARERDRPRGRRRGLCTVWLIARATGAESQGGHGARCAIRRIAPNAPRRGLRRGLTVLFALAAPASAHAVLERSDAVATVVRNTLPKQSCSLHRRRRGP